MISALQPISINFGTDGFRGIIGDNFTFDAVSRISSSLAEYLKDSPSKTVAIGYDTRFLSKEFAAAAAEAIVSSGIKVVLSDNFCPSPVLSYFVKDKKCAAGVMITASHNPYMFNGLKFKSPFGTSYSSILCFLQMSSIDLDTETVLTTLPERPSFIR